MDKCKKCYVRVKDSNWKKIRELREQRKMTRELLCEDETRLTVRQLARIEAGDSIPSLLTLEFIAQQLRIEMYQIIKESTKS